MHVDPHSTLVSLSTWEYIWIEYYHSPVLQLLRSSPTMSPALSVCV